MPAASLWILVAGFLFTLTSMSVKMCAGYFSPFEILFWRSLFGVVCLFFVMVHKGIAFPTKYPLSHLKRSLAGVTCFSLEILALSRLPLSVEQSVSYLSPLIFCFFFIVSSKRAGNRIDWPVIGAVIVGFIGVLMIVRPSSNTFDLIGILLALSAAFAGACVSWFLRDLGRQGEPKERAVFYFMLAGLLMGLIGLSLDPNPIHLPQGKWIAPLIGVMTTALIAQMCWTYAWEKGNSLLNAVFQFAGIFFGVLVGMIAFKEQPDLPTIAGAVTIFLAGLFSSLYFKRKN